MGVQEYEALLNASIHGDTPEARLRSLLLAVRDLLFVEDIDSVAMWITRRKDEGAETALDFLQKADTDFSEGKSEKDNVSNLVGAKNSPEAAYVIELLVPSDSQSKIAGYLHFSKRPATSGDWLQAAAGLIGRVLLEIRRDRTTEKVYSILDSYRESIFRPNKLIRQVELDELAEGVASTFHVRALWVLLYSYGSWRKNPRGGPLVAFHGHQQPFEGIQDYFTQLLNREIYELIKQGTGSAKAVGREIQLSGLPSSLSDPRFYITVAPLISPRVSDAKAGIPYVAVVALKEPEYDLDEQEQDFLRRFVNELQRILRFEDEVRHTRGMVNLLQKFLSLSTPTEVADSIVDYLCKTFKASEVAVLERRGMFLSVIGQKNVPLQAVPPLHIPTTKARVCEVARSQQERYDANAHEIGDYLEVVPSTKSQFTVPLVWRNDLVGVLVLGLSVFDGLEDRNLKVIKALASYCAAAIAGSQRSAEERAISHMLGEVLTGAALKIYPLMQSDEISSTHRDRLKATFSLLNQCQSFIDNFSKAQSSTKRKERVDLSRIVSDYEKDPLFNALLQKYPHCSIEIRTFPKALVANAYGEGLTIAIHNIVSNGLEAMENSPGKISISVDTQKQWYEASRKNIPFGVIKIADEGGGIPRPELVKIFEPFYSTKENHLGSGLHIAQRIIQGFGGQLWVDSPAPESGKGTEFSLWVPLIEKETKKHE